MPTARKIMKTYLITAGYVVMFFFIAIIGILIVEISFLPDTSLGFLWLIPYFKTEITFIPLGIFLVILAYKAYRYVKRTGNPWQTVRENLKPNLIIISSIAFIIYAGMVLFAVRYPAEYDRCDFYNKELGGRVKEYQGRKFKVHLCGTGDYDGRFEYKPDEIRLQVFNEKGDLVALRHFEIDWQSSFDREIEYHSDHIAYIDESSSTNSISISTKTISMPPTTLDWIRARIPLLD